MHSLTLHAHVGKDGILKLETPIGLTETDVEVVLVVQSLPTTPDKPAEKRGWPPGFFEEFSGCMPDLPPRAPQGEYEIRAELK